MVNIPIIFYSSENKSADIHFHQIDKRDNARIKYQRININTGKIVPWEEITRGYEYDKEEIVPVPDEVLKKVAGDNARTIDIQNFIEKNSLDILTIQKTYYLVPEKKGLKGYVILREALKETKKVGIAKVIISTKEYLAAVMFHQDALILCLLKYDDEMKKLSEFDIPNKEINAYKVTKKEIEVAKQLIQSMSVKWKPEKYTDEYQQAIHTWVEETVKHIAHPTKKKSKQKPSKTTAVNFVDLLKKSLASTGKSTAKKSLAQLAKLKAKNPKHITRH